MKLHLMLNTSLGILLLAGCASAGSRYTAYSGHPDQVTPAALAAVNNNHPEDVLCWRTAPVGSHLQQTYCATKEEVAAQKKRDQDAKFWMDNGLPKSNGPGG
jgi:hypothetical protein